MAISVRSSIEAEVDTPGRRLQRPIPSDVRNAVDDQGLAVIVIAAAEGDQRAWEHLSRRFGNMVLAIARSCRLGDADVGEVFQTTWLRLVENIGRIEQPERIGAWLATTARRESLRLVRGKARIAFDSDAFEYLPDLKAPNVDATLLSEERSAAVREAYAKLPPRCQRLLGLLASSDPPSYQDVSKILDMPIGSIGPTRGRCLEHLRRILLEVAPEL
jgi:RNA polymerase sigma factor (sigma-70 family)